MNLKRRKLESEWAIAALSKEVKHGAVRNNGLNLDLLVRGTDHTLIKVHLARLRPWRRNLHMKPAQPNLVEPVRMKKQSCPSTHDGHSVDGGQGRYVCIAVPVKGDALCYVTRMRKICAVVALHVHLASEGLLQQWMHLAVAERPERKHQRNASKRKSKVSDYE